jgi:spermidine synthase
MAGLASGSFAANKLIQRFSKGNLLLTYALIEMGIGLTGLITKFCVPGVGHLLASHAGVNVQPVLWFIGPFFILLVPTFLMGLTYPLLVEWFRSEKAPGTLYGWNTLGAVAGAFFAGFLFIPHLGLSATFFIAAAFNTVAAAVALAASRSDNNQSDSIAVQAPQEAPINWTKRTIFLLSAFFITGLGSIACEVAWTRAFALLLGSSTYAFTIMLVTFLLAIALGAFAFRVIQWYVSPSIEGLSGALFLTAAAILVYLPFFNHLPFLYVRIFPLLIENQFLMDAARFFLCGIVMIFPAFLMGLAFPWILDLLIRENPGRKKMVGIGYGVNTAGCIVGGALTGLFFIPAFGTEQALHICVWIYAAAAALLFFGTQTLSSRRLGVGLSLMVGLVIASAIRPPWDPMVISSGVFLYAPDYYGRKTYRDFQNDASQNTLLFYKDGVSCNVAVYQTPGSGRFLRVNGKTDASSGQDMHTQMLVSFLPALIHPATPEKALVLGLGSGVSAGALSTISSIKKIDCVEIEPAVAEALPLFNAINHSIRFNSKFKLIFSDGRHYLGATKEKYDLIISEPSNPWIAGIANLYTEEAFELSRSRLAPGGVFCQWFHSYSMSVEDFQLIMRTFSSVFPHAMLMTSGYKDFFFVGSNEPWRIDYEKMNRTIAANPDMALDLNMIDLDHPFTLLSSTFLLGDTAFREMAGNGALHKDDRPTLEFTSPRNLYRNLSQLVDQEILRHKKESLPEELVGFSPTKKEFALLYNMAGETYLRHQDLADAEKAFQKAFEADADNARTWANLGRVHNLKTQHFQAEKAYRKSIALDKSFALPWFHLGMMYLEQGLDDQALSYLMEGHKRAPTDPMGTLQIAQLQINRKNYAQAQRLLEEALKRPILNQELNASLEHMLLTAKQKSPAP